MAKIIRRLTGHGTFGSILEDYRDMVFTSGEPDEVAAMLFDDNRLSTSEKWEIFERIF